MEGEEGKGMARKVFLEVEDRVIFRGIRRRIWKERVSIYILRCRMLRTEGFGGWERYREEMKGIACKEMLEKK